MRYHLILWCLCASHLLCAQPELPDFGVNTGDEINLKECSFEKNAGAVVLFDHATSDHDDDWHLITHRRVRIKIFNQRELEQANIRIRFYSRDNFEVIENIRGITSNYENGQFSTAFLEKKNIYTEQEDNRVSVVKFAMPNVKPGSIIEYEYTSYMKHYGGLSSWNFQHEIPTLKSGYLLTVPPGTEFQYNVQKKLNYPMIIKPYPDRGQIYYEMNNLPGLKFEPYMDAVRDYLQRVEFQLSSYMFHGITTKVNQTWGGAANDLISDRDFGGAIKKDLPNTAEIKTLLAGLTTDSSKMAAIYNYVRAQFTCTRDYGFYAPDGLKNAWSKKAGTAGEINLILLNLLRSFDIPAQPILIAERDFGCVDSTYPFLDRFNKVAAYVQLGNRSYVLDATQKYCPADMMPYPLLNTIAFIVDRKTYRLVRLLGNGHSYENQIEVKAKLDSKGWLEGTATIQSIGYSKQLRTESIKQDPKKFIKDVLTEDGSELAVEDCTFENLDEESRPLLQKVKWHNELNLSGGFAFINYNMFTGFAKNPFTASERFTNVNFGFPYLIRLKINLELPQNAKVDKLPAEKTVTWADGTILVARSLKKENNRVVVDVAFQQTTTLIGYDRYNDLKWTYSQINDLLNEAIVVKVAE